MLKLTPRRIGKFKIYDDNITDDRRKMLKNVFKQVVVLEAHFDYAENAIVYVAWSEKFDVIDQSAFIPDYNIWAMRDEVVEFHRYRVEPNEYQPKIEVI